MRFERLYPTFVQIIFTAIGIALIFASSFLLEPINQKREAYKITQNNPLENAPPELVLATTALGGFRGILIDYLWLRATELRNKGSQIGRAHV